MAEERGLSPGTTKRRGFSFAKLKEDLKDGLVTAELEQKYLSGKKFGFKHPEHVEEQIQIMRETREEIPVLREAMSSKKHHYKEVAESEQKIGKSYTEMAQHPRQHPKLKTILEQVSKLYESIASIRFNMVAELEEVNEEWKKFEEVDLKEIRIKQDQMNHHWVAHKFWKKKGEMAKANEYESKYKVAVSDFVNYIHEVREKKETQIPTYLLTIIQSETRAHKAISEKYLEMESLIRQLGPVTSIHAEGLDKFSISNLTLTGAPATLALPAPQPQQLSLPPPQVHAPIQARAPVPQVSVPQVAPPKVTVTSQQQNTARALYDYQGTSQSDLSFKRGDVLTILKQEGQWWEAKLGNKQGFIPYNYVQLY